MLRLSFNQSESELMVRAAATILFRTLDRQNIEQVNISVLAEHPQYGFTASAVAAPVGPKLVRITDLQDGKIDWDSVPYCECAGPDKYLLRENDILFARTGATTGKTHLVRSPEPAIFASYLIRLRPKPGVDAGYLYAFFQSDNYWSQISEEKEGSAQPNVNGEKLLSLRIPIVGQALQRAIAEFVTCVRRRQDGDSETLPALPEPLAEQRRVVARIEEFLAKIDEARRLRKSAEEEIHAVFEQARAETFERASRRGTQQLSKVAVLERGKFSHRPRNDSRFFGGEHPWIQIAEIEGSNKYIRKWSDTLNDEGLAISKKFPKGTVLISIAATIGAVGILDFDCCVPDSIVGVTPRPGIDSEFLYHYLGYVRSHLEKVAPQSAQKNINLQILSPLPFPRLEIAEQRQIAAELDLMQSRVDSLHTLQSETSAEFDVLMPSILDKAFRGEL